MDGFLQPPDKGWGDSVYIVVKPPNKAPGASGEPADGVRAGEEDGGELEERTETKLEDEEFSSMAYSSDSYKRKLEDSEGQRASKNPRSQSPDNYVSTGMLIHLGATRVCPLAQCVFLLDLHYWNRDLN